MALGHKSVRETQEAISSKEFSYWLAYYQIEPYGGRAEDRRAGTIAAMLYNVNRKKGAKAKNWLDFFPEYKVRKTASPDELLKMAEALNAAFGGDDLRVKEEG